MHSFIHSIALHDNLIVSHCVSYNFISFMHVVSPYFMSFDSFTSFYLIASHFIYLHLISIHFNLISLWFPSNFTLFHIIHSCDFNSYHFQSILFHAISFHLISCHVMSFNFIHSLTHSFHSNTLQFNLISCSCHLILISIQSCIH